MDRFIGILGLALSIFAGTYSYYSTRTAHYRINEVIESTKYKIEDEIRQVKNVLDVEIRKVRTTLDEEIEKVRDTMRAHLVLSKKEEQMRPLRLEKRTNAIEEGVGCLLGNIGDCEEAFENVIE
jgi:hypothetical protein